MIKGKILIEGCGEVEIYYEFVNLDTIKYVDPSGRYHYTSYKSLIA